MKSVILAAGMGTRLSPLTEIQPKCLIEVEGKSILQRQIEAFNKAGVSEIIIVVGYKNELVKKFIEKQGYNNIRIIINYDYKITNNMYSLYLAKDYLENEFILVNGDVIFDLSIISELIQHSDSNLIAAQKGTYNEESMKIVVNKQNRIEAISKTIPQNMAYGNSIDVYKLSNQARKILFNRILEYIEVEKNVKSWTEVAMHDIFDKIKFKPFDIKNKIWIEIDDMNDFQMACNLCRLKGENFCIK